MAGKQLDVTSPARDGGDREERECVESEPRGRCLVRGSMHGHVVGWARAPCRNSAPAKLQSRYPPCLPGACERLRRCSEVRLAGVRWVPAIMDCSGVCPASPATLISVPSRTFQTKHRVRPLWALGTPRLPGASRKRTAGREGRTAGRQVIQETRTRLPLRSSLSSQRIQVQAGHQCLLPSEVRASI